MLLEFLTVDGTIVPFPSLKFRVGSAQPCEVCLERLEPQHVEVWSDNGGHNWRIRALGPTQNLWVNGSSVREGRVSSGAKLSLGDVQLEVRLTRATPSEVGLGGELLEVPARSPFLEPGCVIDHRYEIVERLASGGMGQVYRALHVELRKPLALKIMLPSLSDNQDFIARFKREAIAVSRVGHENIVDVTDFGRTDDGRFFFVMELVDGLTLAQQLRQDGPFTPARMLRVAVQVARCLMAAHAAGVVHRDLKPENVMLVQRPSSLDFVKVLDFGIAKVEASGTTRFGGQTAVGMVVGTPQYMPPEQARGLAIDGRTDVYTLGLIMHELLMGRPCFRGDSPAALLLMQLSAEPPPLALPGMPAGLEALIMQMLQKKADDRPASMAEVLSRLESLLLRVDPQRRRTESNPELDPASVAATIQVEGVHQPPDAPTALLPVEPAVVTAVAQPKRAVQRRPSTRQSVAPQTQVPAAVAPVPADDEPLPTLQRSRAPLLVGVVATIGLLAGVVALVVRSPAAVVASTPAPMPPAPVPSATRPADPPSAPPAARPSVRLSITSTPPGAEVYAADVLLGTTPLTLQRPVDTVAELRFELSGYENVSRKVGFSADHTLNIALEALKRAAPPPPLPPRVTPPPARAKAQDLKEAPF